MKIDNGDGEVRINGLTLAETLDAGGRVNSLGIHGMFGLARAMMSSKVDLLAHYADREPCEFVQIDCWRYGKEGVVRGVGITDTLGATDDDGDCLNGGVVTELMSGSDVRILIPPRISSADAIALLRKAIAWIERDGIQGIHGMCT
jgi:hypothetical protein